jgi:2-oxoglutarate ferredoxin oxidoreductase subunit beta
MNKIEIQVEGMETVWEKPETLSDVRMHYCPGCGHGVVHKILMEVVQEMKIQDKTIGVAPVGCSVLAYHYLNVDMQEAAHGRATAVATGIKRVLPDKLVFTYGIYGMTGGQMAPTSLVGMKTSTTPEGRQVETQGYPFKITEVVATLPGTHYVTRQAAHTPSAVRFLKKSIEKAFKYQIENKGTCLIEIVSNCPSGWKMTPVQSNKWLEENMFSYYPLGDLKDNGKIVEKKIQPAAKKEATQ